MNGKEDSAAEIIKHGIAEYEYKGVRYFGDTAEADAKAAYQKDLGASSSSDGAQEAGSSDASWA
jgi:hypothetical protein